MKINYVWSDSESTDDEAATTESRPPRRRWALLLIIALAAVALIVQQTRRVQSQEQALRQEVVASFQLWHQALRGGDQELFLFQMADRDQAWEEDQAQLFALRRLLDRPAFGLRYVPADGAPQVTEVDLAPDWQSAALSARYLYVIEESGDRSYLQRTFQFQRQDDHWLLTSPDADFWGPEQTLREPGLTIVYPRRDGDLVGRLARDLAQDLENLCGQLRPQDDHCLRTAGLRLRFETDPMALAALHDRLTPVLHKGVFLLPTPALVGLPQDEAAYQALYGGYTLRILRTVASNLRPLASGPQQDLALLCFPERGQPLRLFRYEVAADRWTPELPAQEFRSLLPMPGGNGVILQEEPGAGEESARLRLLHWQGDQKRLVLDQVVLEQLRRPAGWASSAQPRLLLHDLHGDRSFRYHWLDLEQCGPSGCRVVDLPGYTTWSPYGTHTLLLEGDNLWRGDHEAQPLVPLGAALAPFWLDNERYGYVRYDREAGAPSMQVVTATVGVDLPHIVLPVQALAEQIDAQSPPLTFLNYVAPVPGDPHLLLLWATAVGASEGTHTIFSYRLSSGELGLVAQFEQLPRGDPSRLTPAGHPPFRFSPDGRWLLVTSLQRQPSTSWHFQLYDLRQDRDQDFLVNYPAYPTPFPIYDWTSDGRWLAVVGDGLLRLTAPATGYEKVVPFRFENCLYAAWMAAG